MAQVGCRRWYAVLAMFLLPLACDGQNMAAPGSTQNPGSSTSTSCGATDPDSPSSPCTVWTCMNVPAQYATKTHCTAAQPPGAAHPNGDYSCPATSGGNLCPGNNAGGMGPWDCRATEFTLTCDRTSGAPGGSATGYPGGTDTPLPGGSTECYYPTGSDPASTRPAATVAYVLESRSGVDVIHVRLTFDPAFVDNTYGTTAIGWITKGHKFKDLVGSDKAELQMFNLAGTLVLDYKLDYISASTGSTTQYRNLGVSGGDGGMVMGSPAAVVATMTSLDRNLNERGYGSFIVNSPATDANYTPNPAAPNWDYRVVYEAWIETSAISGGFGSIRLSFVHASPSKTGQNTETVEPHPCPPGWVG